MLETAVALPSEITAPLEKNWSVDDAFTYCTALTKRHYENFPVGSWLMPARLQPAIHSLYAFMRTADDFSDEDRRAGDEAERLAAIDAWEAMLEECVRGQARHPVFVALAATLEEYDLPAQWLRDLLTAFRMDVTVRRYAAYGDVLAYCRYSANPVGRLILAVSGYRDEELYQQSDAICTGLQLANHWQDVAVDLKKDRIYLPQKDLSETGVPEGSLFEWLQHPDRSSREWRNFRLLMQLEIARARGLFARGRALPANVKGRLRWELALTWRGGVRVLDKISAAHYDVFARRPTVTKRDWAALFWKTLVARGLP